MYCGNCGNKLEEGQEVCLKCGKVVRNINNNSTNSNSNPNAKSRIAAGVLGILLGALGIHNFYLGYTNKGITQLLITVLSCGVLSFVSALWGLIEGIMILVGSINVDANGDVLKD